MATIVRQKGLAPIEGTSEVKSFLKERGIDYDHWKVPYNVADLTDKEILADVEKEELLKNWMIVLKLSKKKKVINPEI